MQSYKPVLESLLARIYEREESEGITHPQQGHVNRSIQQLGQKYGSDCKATFDELSATVQKVSACAAIQLNPIVRFSRLLFCCHLLRFID